MARAHLEIAHLGRVFEQLLDDLPEDGPEPRGPDGPAPGPLRAARDPATALRAGGGGLRVARVGDDDASASVAASSRLGDRRRSPPPAGSADLVAISVRPVAAGMRRTGRRGTTRRRRDAPRPTRAPSCSSAKRATSVSPTPTPGRCGDGVVALPERLEDLLALLGRHSGAVVLDDDQRAALPWLDAHPDPRRRRRVPDRVREQVLHDPLDLGRVARRSRSRPCRPRRSARRALRNRSRARRRARRRRSDGAAARRSRGDRRSRSSRSVTSRSSLRAFCAIRRARSRISSCSSSQVVAPHA